PPAYDGHATSTRPPAWPGDPGPGHPLPATPGTRAAPSHSTGKALNTMSACVIRLPRLPGRNRVKCGTRTARHVHGQDRHQGRGQGGPRLTPRTCRLGHIVVEGLPCGVALGVVDEWRVYQLPGCGQLQLWGVAAR